MGTFVRIFIILTLTAVMLDAEEPAGHEIIVTGHIAQPGRYSYSEGESVWSAAEKAGGTIRLWNFKVSIRREKNGETETLFYSPNKNEPGFDVQSKNEPGVDVQSFYSRIKVRPNDIIVFLVRTN